MDRIQQHFEEEAGEYDGNIINLIPNYKGMVDMLVSVLPFDKQQPFEMIDLGCGTGTISKAVKDSFPAVSVTCADIARNMLDIAGQKMGAEAKLIQADFNTFEFPQKFDAAVSSLALHHLVTDDDKLKFYEKIYNALNPGGIFINIDVVLAGNDALQHLYMEKWKAFMLTNVPALEVEQTWIPSYYAEDHPASLTSHFDMMAQCGFSDIDAVFKQYNFAVYCGRK